MTLTGKGSELASDKETLTDSDEDQTEKESVRGEYKKRTGPQCANGGGTRILRIQKHASFLSALKV